MRPAEHNFVNANPINIIHFIDYHKYEINNASSSCWSTTLTMHGKHSLKEREIPQPKNNHLAVIGCVGNFIEGFWLLKSKIAATKENLHAEKYGFKNLFRS